MSISAVSLGTESTAGEGVSAWQVLCHLPVPEYQDHLSIMGKASLWHMAKLAKNSQMSRGMGCRCVFKANDRGNIHFLAQ